MDWKPFFYNDSTLEATGDTIEVTSRVLHITGVHVKYTSSATAGNRVLNVKVVDSDDDAVIEVRSGAVQAASTVRYYNFGTSLANMTAFVDTDYLTNALPDVWIPQGCKFVVVEQTQIDPDSDAMELQIFGEIAGYEV